MKRNSSGRQRDKKSRCLLFLLLKKRTSCGTMIVEKLEVEKTEI